MKCYFLLLLVQCVLAQSPWQSVLRSRESRDLLGLVQEESYVRNCQWERSHHQFPKNCFKVFIEQLKKPRSATELKKMRDQLDKSCQENYQSLVDVSEIQGLLREWPVSFHCHEILKEHLKDLQYRNAKEVGSDFEMKREHESSFSEKSLL